MRRTMLVAVLTAALTVFTAGPAFAGHCVNLSKQADAGNLTTVLVNPLTEEVTIVEGQIRGGYADVYVDFNLNSVADEGELVEEDIQIGKNHSPQYDEVEPWVNPGAINKFFGDNNATTEQGWVSTRKPERSE